MPSIAVGDAVSTTPPAAICFFTGMDRNKQKQVAHALIKAVLKPHVPQAKGKDDGLSGAKYADLIRLIEDIAERLDKCTDPPPMSCAGNHLRWNSPILKTAFTGFREVVTELQGDGYPSLADDLEKRYSAIEDATVSSEATSKISVEGWMDCAGYSINLVTEIPAMRDKLLDIAHFLRRASIGKSNEPGPAGGAKINKEEANVRARQLLRQTPTWDWTTRKLAGQIPCSLGWISSLPAWRAYHEKRKELKRTDTIDAVSLTDTMETVLGVGEKDEVLHQLIADQEGDEREDAKQAKLYLSHEKKRKRRES